jgi:hypothetical protein
MEAPPEIQEKNQFSPKAYRKIGGFTSILQRHGE